jgi:hypothetical protein
MTNPLLEEKYKVQRKLDEEAQHVITEYAKNSHRIVGEVEAIYGGKFKYGLLQGDSMDLCKSINDKMQ